MRYFVTIGARTVEVELGGEQTIIDGRPVRAELRALPGTPIRHLLVDAGSHVLLAAPAAARDAWQIQIDGRRFDVEVVDERTRAIRALTASTAAPAGPKPVTAPMPGMIVRVEVEPGQQLSPGEGVIIIEAMKMENELKAAAAGIVARVHVAAGQAVEKGQVLVEFELPPDQQRGGNE